VCHTSVYTPTGKRLWRRSAIPISTRLPGNSPCRRAGEAPFSMPRFCIAIVVHPCFFQMSAI
jgi:hypothetical protein